MAVSRGSIHHEISEDLASLFSVYSNPAFFLSRPKAHVRELTCQAVNNLFPDSEVTLFPFARTAFYAILQSLSLPPGSEVLLTPFNISPMLDIIYALGYKPVFVEINTVDFGPRIDDLIQKMKRKPGCFLLTYLFGYVPHLNEILRVCDSHNVPLIEDISQAIGATYSGQSLGTFGFAAFYSASLTKYIDAYNGAFVVTNSSTLHLSLIKFTQNCLSDPGRSRIISTIQKTLFWNIALSHKFFTCFTFPVLQIIKRLNFAFFETLLGPSILPNGSNTLPSYYFEDISVIQCKSLVFYIQKLALLLKQRRESVNLALPFFNPVAITHKFNASPSYWQYVCRVSDVSSARHLLFSHGIETGTTKLPNLSEESSLDMCVAQDLKTTVLFIPVHKHLGRRYFAKIYYLLNHAGLLITESNDLS